MNKFTAIDGTAQSALSIVQRESSSFIHGCSTVFTGLCRQF